MNSWVERILTSFDQHSMIALSAILSGIIATVRTAKDGKVSYLEALLCALITVGLSTILIFANLPQYLSWLIGTFVGSLGSQWVQTKMRNQANRYLSADVAKLHARLDSLEKSKESTD